MVGHSYILEPMLMISKYFWNGYYMYVATYQSWDESEKRNHKSFILWNVAINPFDAMATIVTEQKKPSHDQVTPPICTLFYSKTIPGKENKL